MLFSSEPSERSATRAVTQLSPIFLLAIGACATSGPQMPVPAIPEPAGEVVDPTALPAGAQVFTSSGEPSSWEALIAAAEGARIVLLGEYHDDVLGHRTRHALVRALAGASGTATSGAGAACAPHVISLEMLETDVQVVVDEYQAGLITGDHFRRAARPWDNHDRDYEPYLEIARDCDFPVVAANPPRRYVNRVARLGEEALNALSAEALATLPPLPVAPPSDRYRAQWNALMGGAAGGQTHGTDPDEPAEPAYDPVLAAQNVWDAGMAWAIARAADAHPDARIIHVAGAFHVQDGTGIPEHLERYLPGAETLIVVAYPVAIGTEFDPEDHAASSGFVLLTER